MSNEECKDQAEGAGVVITRLAELPERAMVDEAGLARILGISPRTIRNLVARGEIPPSIIIGKRAWWLVGKLLSYLEDRAEESLRQGEQTMRRLKVVS